MSHTSEISIPYDRKLTDADMTAILARLVMGISVLGQLGTAYANLPRHAKADLEAKEEAIEATMEQLKVHIAAIELLLRDLDIKGAEADALNKSLLQLLRGMLAGTPQEDLLDQITALLDNDSTTTTPATP